VDMRRVLTGEYDDSHAGSIPPGIELPRAGMLTSVADDALPPGTVEPAGGARGTPGAPTRRLPACARHGAGPPPRPRASGMPRLGWNPGRPGRCGMDAPHRQRYDRS